MPADKEYNISDVKQLDQLDRIENALKEALLDIQHTTTILTRKLLNGNSRSDVDNMVLNSWVPASAIRYRADELKDAIEGLDEIRIQLNVAFAVINPALKEYRRLRIEAGDADPELRQ